ncbi:YqaE/Pmp3 family membrane protein [Acetobacteraceae bacterium]|nr:YqaE/Pmp3 family membrane protein [Acetobacteraceae bacterium]
MRLIIAFFLPWLAFFTIERPMAGIICLLLQLTVLGWPFAAVWAIWSICKYDTAAHH